MQLADRGSLADRLHAVTGSAGLRPREAVDLAARLADAVEVIHRLGFVHRDLKPSNVLFRSRRVHEDGDDDEVLMLADLGLAKALSDASGLASSVGTAAYMPPEQADPSRAADERSDVYSLGVITYELLTGDVPTAGAEVRPSLAAIPGIAPSTVDAVTSALDPRIELRPPSAAAFRDALGSSAGVAAVSAASSRTVGATRRRRQGILALAVIVVVSCAGAAWARSRSEGRHAALTTVGSHTSTSVIAATNARTHASTITERGDPSTTAGRAHASTTVTAAGVPLAGTTPTAAPFVTAPIAPLARFSASAETVRVGQTVNLQSIANEGVTSWRWDLGDGRTTTGAEVKVSWSDAAHGHDHTYRQRPRRRLSRNARGDDRTKTPSGTYPAANSRRTRRGYDVVGDVVRRDRRNLEPLRLTHDHAR